MLIQTLSDPQFRTNWTQLQTLLGPMFNRLSGKSCRTLKVKFLKRQTCHPFAGRYDPHRQEILITKPFKIGNVMGIGAQYETLFHEVGHWGWNHFRPDEPAIIDDGLTTQISSFEWYNEAHSEQAKLWKAWSNLNRLVNEGQALLFSWLCIEELRQEDPQAKLIEAMFASLAEAIFTEDSGAALLILLLREYEMDLQRTMIELRGINLDDPSPKTWKNLLRQTNQLDLTRAFQWVRKEYRKRWCNHSLETDVDPGLFGECIDLAYEEVKDAQAALERLGPEVTRNVFNRCSSFLQRLEKFRRALQKRNAEAIRDLFAEEHGNDAQAVSNRLLCLAIEIDDLEEAEEMNGAPPIDIADRVFKHPFARKLSALAKLQR